MICGCIVEKDIIEGILAMSFIVFENGFISSLLVGLKKG